MTRETLPKALQLMFGHEGGYSNKKTDSGGPTKYGITQKTLAAHRGRPMTADDVKRLTLAEAEAIYVQSYWPQRGGDVLAAGLDYAAFDFGVSSGPARAVKMLQGVLGIVQDGNAGVQTAAAAKDYSGGMAALIKDYCDARLAFCHGLKGPQGWGPNGRGWERRITGIDPKGIIRPEPGVIGNALNLAVGVPPEAKSLPLPDSEELGTAKAVPPPQPTMITKENIGWAVSVLSAITAAFSANPILSSALAVVIVGGAAFGGLALYRRIKATPA
jgi:lysozyme family protein